MLVFDWDGTLADSTALIAASIQAACRDLGEPVPDDDAARYVIGLGFGSAVEHVAPALAQAHYPAFSAAYRSHYLLREPEIPLFAGVRDLLHDLDAEGYLLAIATGKTRAGLDSALARNDLGGVFHATRCADEGRAKPHPDMLLNLMSSLCAAPDRTLMIGDTSHDIELARNAGAGALAVSYGAHSHETLARCAPLATVTSVAELRAWLGANG
jgi:phosphoglycolate phosphatase